MYKNPNASVFPHAQGSTQWLNERLGRYTSTLIAKIKNKPTATAIKQFTVGDSFQENEHTRRGNQCEFPIREVLNDEFLADFQPVTLIDESRNHLASLDGIDIDWGICEIKCPENRESATYQSALKGEIPENHYLQMQFAMGVSGETQGVYAVCYADIDDNGYWVIDPKNLIKQVVHFCPNKWAEILSWIDRFQEHIDGVDILDDKLPQGHAELTAEYLQLKQQQADIKVRIDELESALKDIGEHTGNGVCVSEVKGRKTTSWQAIAKELNPTPEIIAKHTKQGKPTLRVSILKGE